MYNSTMTTNTRHLVPCRPPVGWGNADESLKKAWREYGKRLTQTDQPEEPPIPHQDTWAAGFEEYHQ